MHMESDRWMLDATKETHTLVIEFLYFSVSVNLTQPLLFSVKFAIFCSLIALRAQTLLRLFSVIILNHIFFFKTLQ